MIHDGTLLSVVCVFILHSEEMAGLVKVMCRVGFTRCTACLFDQSFLAFPMLSASAVGMSLPLGTVLWKLQLW